MEFRISTGQLLAFCRNNWFKLTVVALCLYIYLGKDFSFNLQVHVPENKEQTTPSPKEKMTDNSSLTAHIDKLELPFIGSRTPPKRNPSAELAAITDETKHAYLQRFAKVALQEQERYDIPASIILGTALYQSLAGKRDMTMQSNNHFALACEGGWRSACQSFQGKSYRKYESAWVSFRDFSQFADSHFASLKGSDYTSWAMGMQRAGFGEDESFAKNLIEIIEGYRLKELDK